jgi:hypothetical protein
MKRPPKDPKTAIEGWIDERIQHALTGLTQPFEKRIAALSERIHAMQKRVQRITDRLEDCERGDEDAPKKR